MFDWRTSFFETKVSISHYDDQYCWKCQSLKDMEIPQTCGIYGSLKEESRGFSYRHKDCLLAQKNYIESVVLKQLYHEKSLAVRCANKWRSFISELEFLKRNDIEEFERIEKVFKDILKEEEIALQKVQIEQENLKQLELWIMEIDNV